MLINDVSIRYLTYAFFEVFGPFIMSWQEINTNSGAFNTSVTNELIPYKYYLINKIYRKKQKYVINQKMLKSLASGIQYDCNLYK